MKILKSTDEQETYIEDRLEAYNEKRHPLTQERPAVVFSYTALEGQDVIGGIIGYASLYKIGYIDTLWVNEKYRHKSIGTQLLKKLRKICEPLGVRSSIWKHLISKGLNFIKLIIILNLADWSIQLLK